MTMIYFCSYGSLLSDWSDYPTEYSACYLRIDDQCIHREIADSGDRPGYHSCGSSDDICGNLRGQASLSKGGTLSDKKTLE